MLGAGAGRGLLCYKQNKALIFIHSYLSKKGRPMFTFGPSLFDDSGNCTYADAFFRHVNRFHHVRQKQKIIPHVILAGT